MPPSPWLSARMEMSTYLRVVMSVTVQMTRLSAPSTNSCVTLPMPPLPATSALVTYMGLVPMSPYTTPSVTSMPAMLMGMAAGCPPMTLVLSASGISAVVLSVNLILPFTKNGSILCASLDACISRQAIYLRLYAIFVPFSRVRHVDGFCVSDISGLLVSLRRRGPSPSLWRRAGAVRLPNVLSS